MLFRWQTQSLKSSSMSDVDSGVRVSKVIDVQQVKGPEKAPSITRASVDDYVKAPKDGVTITVTGMILLQ